MESGKDVEAKQLISKLDRTQLTDIGVKNLAVIEATYAIKDNDILKAKSVLREAIQKKSDNDLMFALFQLDAKTNEPEEAIKLAAVLQDSQKNDLYFVTFKYYLAERMLEDGKEIESMRRKNFHLRLQVIADLGNGKTSECIWVTEMAEAPSPFQKGSDEAHSSLFELIFDQAQNEYQRRELKKAQEDGMQ